MAGDIKITENELPNLLEIKLHAYTDGTKIQIGKDKNISVQLGAPLSKSGKFDFPNNPHVYTTDQLSIRDKDHQQAVVLNNVTVIMAHGTRNADQWKFINEQPITETVVGYNEWALLNNMPLIEAVIACNEDELVKQTGVQVFEFPRGGIIHAVGEDIRADCHKWPGGKLWTKISTDTTSILNLDETIMLKRIKI